MNETSMKEMVKGKIFKTILPTSINHHKIKQKVIKMSHFAICHAKSEIKSNEGTLETPALKHNGAKH